MRRKSRKSTQLNLSGVSNTPSGTFSPLRSASFWISAGGAVPSRWTCSSASGMLIRARAGRGARPAASAPTWTAFSSAVAASRALVSPRAWTIASGRSGPTCGADRGDLGEPDAVVDRSSSRRRLPPRPVTTRPTARVSTLVDVAGALRDHRQRAPSAAGQLRVLDEVGGAAEGVDHVAEALGRGAAVERALAPRASRSTSAWTRAAASATVTSCRRGSRAAPVR